MRISSAYSHSINTKSSHSHLSLRAALQFHSLRDVSLSEHAHSLSQHFPPTAVITQSDLIIELITSVKLPLNQNSTPHDILSHIRHTFPVTRYSYNYLTSFPSYLSLYPCELEEDTAVGVLVVLSPSNL
ncbi:hypothetical protein Tco_0904367 [Tanacetum coccineum]